MAMNGVRYHNPITITIGAIKRRYRDTCEITKEDMIAFLQANTSYTLKASIKNTTADVRIYYGEKETRGIKQSVQKIKEMLPTASVTVLSGMVHGDFSINYAADYVKAIRSL